MSNGTDNIRQRFGQYQAIEELESRGTARLWHAWDPYLGRFVIIASLAEIDGESLQTGLANLDAALRGWTGVASFTRRDVLHFFPGNESESAFVVLAPKSPATAFAEETAPPRVAAAAVPASESIDFERDAAARPERRSESRAGTWIPLLLALIGILALPIVLYLLSRDGACAAPVPPPMPATATPTHCIAATATSTATPLPTSTPARAKPRAAAKPAAPAAKAPASRPKQAAPAIGAPIAPAPEPPIVRYVPDEADAPTVIQPGTVTAMTRRATNVGTLVREWLLAHCHRIETAYLEAGRNFACGWMGVTIDGELPEITVTYTQIERHLPTERDLYTNKVVRLLCTDHCITLEEDTVGAEIY